MPLANRRQEYEWPATLLADARLQPEKRQYNLSEKVTLAFGFRIVGGFRESFTPDVWTVAWEDYDKSVRLKIEQSVVVSKVGVFRKEVAKIKKSVRKSTFYWSRDPDLPYRIWVMVLPEDGSKPIIPRNVEEAKSKMFDVDNKLFLQGSDLGKGRHVLYGSASVSWGRHSWIEKGGLSGKSNKVTIDVE
jgi:hypothetical protein